MSIKPPRFLARAGKLPGGWATGGGETPFDVQPQPALYTVALSDSRYKDVVLPKGTLILAWVVLPEGPSLPEDTRAAATGGTVTIDTWNIVTNASIAAKLASTSASAYSRTAEAGGLLLTAETRFRFRATSITPATTGLVRVGMEMILPRIRA